MRTLNPLRLYALAILLAIAGLVGFAGPSQALAATTDVTVTDVNATSLPNQYVNVSNRDPVPIALQMAGLSCYATSSCASATAVIPIAGKTAASYGAGSAVLLAASDTLSFTIVNNTTLAALLNASLPRSVLTWSLPVNVFDTAAEQTSLRLLRTAGPNNTNFNVVSNNTVTGTSATVNVVLLKQGGALVPRDPLVTSKASPTSPRRDSPDAQVVPTSWGCRSIWSMATPTTPTGIAGKVTPTVTTVLPSEYTSAARLSATTARVPVDGPRPTPSYSMPKIC